MVASQHFPNLSHKKLNNENQGLMQKIFFLHVFILLLFFSGMLSAQDSTKKKLPVKITGVIGITYEGYGLTVNPKTPSFYPPRRPWNQVRFNFAPQIKVGNFSLPINFNFATKAVNFAGPYAGIAALGKQSLKQWITNPMNNFSINPKYKWAELQLGTQYLNYSDLSTGDIGVFGAGFDLKPKGYILKFFTGTSQQGINYSASPLVPGAYKRTNWMAQIGKEEEGKYKLAFTAAKGKDFYNSATPPPLTINPQEGFVLSLLTDVNFKKGFYFNTEAAQGMYTQNSNAGTSSSSGVRSIKPFIRSNTSTVKDYAATASIGKKSTNFDMGVKTKYLGAGYYTMGYPYLQPDKFDVTVNTRFNAWKDSSGSFKMNIVASAGQRINNMSNTTLRAKQFIGSLNWFTQFNEHMNLNITYNNFGFNAAGNTLNGIPSIKNVSNDIGINPSCTWSNTKMSNLLSLSYNYSKYDETVITPPSLTTSNNTHTILLSYIPTYFTKKLVADFSFLYFLNKIPGFTTRLMTISAGAGGPLAQNKLNLKGQLQYTIGKNGLFTGNNNLIAGLTADYNLTKKLNWNCFISTSRYKYGNELGVGLIGANYLESTIRTGLTYRLK